MNSAKPYESRPGWSCCYPKKADAADWAADFAGVTVLDGKKYWINVFEKVTPEGERYLSVSLRLKEDR